MAVNIGGVLAAGKADEIIDLAGIGGTQCCEVALTQLFGRYAKVVHRQLPHSVRQRSRRRLNSKARSAICASRSSGVTSWSSSRE